MNKLVLIICITFISSQGNYQILSTPSDFKETFKLYEFHQDKNYSVFNSSLPGDINIFSATISSRLLNKQGSNALFFLKLKNIDYGTLVDSETNYQFGAHESAIEFNFFKDNYLEDIDCLFNIGYLKSSIDVFDSEAIYIGLKVAVPTLDNDEIIISLENFGMVTDSYSSSNMSLPETASLLYMINTKFPFSILLNYEKRLDLDDEVLYGTIHMNINPRLDLYLSTNSNRSDLFYGDYIQELTAGLRIGVSYFKDSNLFNLGFQDLGAAGYSTSFSFSKTIL